VDDHGDILDGVETAIMGQRPDDDDIGTRLIEGGIDPIPIL
jgi:hypothetical protein